MTEKSHGYQTIIIDSCKSNRKGGKGLHLSLNHGLSKIIMLWQCKIVFIMPHHSVDATPCKLSTFIKTSPRAIHQSSVIHWAEGLHMPLSTLTLWVFPYLWIYLTKDFSFFGGLFHWSVLWISILNLAGTDYIVERGNHKRRCVTGCFFWFSFHWCDCIGCCIDSINIAKTYFVLWAFLNGWVAQQSQFHDWKLWTLYLFCLVTSHMPQIVATTILKKWAAVPLINLSFTTSWLDMLFDL